MLGLHQQKEIVLRRRRLGLCRAPVSPVRQVHPTPLGVAGRPTETSFPCCEGEKALTPRAMVRFVYPGDVTRTYTPRTTPPPRTHGLYVPPAGSPAAVSSLSPPRFPLCPLPPPPDPSPRYGSLMGVYRLLSAPLGLLFLQHLSASVALASSISRTVALPRRLLLSPAGLCSHPRQECRTATPSGWN